MVFEQGLSSKIKLRISGQSGGGGGGGHAPCNKSVTSPDIIIIMIIFLGIQIFPTTLSTKR